MSLSFTKNKRWYFWRLASKEIYQEFPKSVKREIYQRCFVREYFQKMVTNEFWPKVLVTNEFLSKEFVTNEFSPKLLQTNFHQRWLLPPNFHQNFLSKMFVVNGHFTIGIFLGIIHLRTIYNFCFNSRSAKKIDTLIKNTEHGFLWSRFCNVWKVNRIMCLYNRREM